MRKYSLLGFFFILLSMLGLPAQAQTPDGDTPANEGVCDGLIGLTPGLYGLCVGFCEAQDCEATFDPATEEVAFNESCKPSSPKLLQNYNKRLQPGDPPMPCVNITQNECPCWTEAELDLVADGITGECGPAGSLYDASLYGGDSSTGEFELERAFVRGSGSGTGGRCLLIEKSLNISRLQTVTHDEVLECRESILQECASRGF